MNRRTTLYGLGGVAGLALAIAFWPGGDEAAKGDEAARAGESIEGLPRYDEWSAGAQALAEGRVEEAREALAKEAAGSVGDRRAQALFFLGCCQGELGDSEAAAGTWRTLLSDHPGSLYCGDALARMGRVEEAFQRYPESEGARRSALDLADGYAAEGQAEAAVRAYSLVLAGGFEAGSEARAKRAIGELREDLWKSGGAQGGEHVVERGDSLWKIAKKFGTTPGMLRFANGLSSDNLRVGERLVVFGTDFLIRVGKESHLLRLFVDGVFLREYVVGLGTRGCTPAGEFRIATKKENPPWYYEGKMIPYGDPRNVLGTRWMGFENKPGATGYGIHGTAMPESIGKDESSGCVRMHNHEVEELFELVPIGARVVIHR